MRKCMVLMPFRDEEMNKHYTLVVKKAVESSGIFKCFRVDEIPHAAYRITSEIIQGIEQADVVIANITHHNANVFYELGMAHSFGNNVLIICDKSESFIPFDIKDYNILMYENSDTGNANLTDGINSALKNMKWGAKPNNPIQHYSESKKYLLDFPCPNSDTNYDNTSAAKEVFAEIQSWSQRTGIPELSKVEKIIAINGPVAVGKTTFSNCLKTVINEIEGEGSAEVFPLDSFMVDRNELHQRSVPNGYEDTNWDMKSALEKLRELVLNNRAIQLPEYSHKSGRHISGKIKVNPSKYIILDGLISFNDLFSEFVTAKIYVCGKNTRSEQNPRIQVAYHERNYTLKDALIKSERELKDYCHYLLPKRREADAWLVMKDKTWQYDLYFDYPNFFEE